MKDMELVYRLVIFSILMQNENGIIGKSPGYILEKYDSIMNMKNPENLLDSNNRNIYENYKKLWMIEGGEDG